MNNPITIECVIAAPMEKVWKYWTEPEHIVRWAFASDDWEAPSAENDLREGGRFSTTMAAKDGSASFVFSGMYTNVDNHKKIAYTMDDGRKVYVVFEEVPEGVRVVESFDPEHENSEEMQRDGWQAILNNFKKHVENN